MSTLGPRLVIAGTHSGVGKTTVATGLMAALAAAGQRVASAKVGPDFIDPGYHALATGRPPRNLDAWICGPDAVAPLAGRAATGADVLIVEGVMGLFDGAADGAESSTADIAARLDAPVVLVVDASAMSASVAALVRGFRDHDTRLRFGGVILNRVASDAHAAMATEALDSLGVAVFGVIGRDAALVWRDRHLGLVPVAEQPSEARRGLNALAGAVTRQCDLAALMNLARTAPARTVAPVALPERVTRREVRIAVAGGAAFTFCYEDNLDALRGAGAELVTFDPLVDRCLPEGVSGLIVGGGFPEVYAEALAANEALTGSVRLAISAGLVTWAECGGLVWLCRSLGDVALAGVLPARAEMTQRLTLGYRTAEVHRDNPVAGAGTSLRGHEFHYSALDPGGDAFTLRSRFGQRNEGFASPTLTASYLHLHLGGDPAPAARFVATCAARPS